jgi:hypothetical protein
MVGGGGNLREELHREIWERVSPEPRITSGGGGWERERKERAKKEEEGLKPNQYRDKSVSFVGVLLRYKGAALTARMAGAPWLNSDMK